MNFTLLQLRYLAAVARQGSFTAAARALNVSQPSISVAVDQVEKSFRQKLFVRQRGSGVALTTFGRMAVAKAMQVLAEADELAVLVSSTAVAGELVLGCFEDLGPHFAPGLIRSFSKRYPSVQMVIREETFETLGRRLSESAIDLGLTYDLGLPANVARVTLHELRPHALLSADHPLAAHATVSLADLEAYSLIASDQPYSWQHTLDLFQSRGLSAVIGKKVGSFELQRSLVANGLGVAVCWTRPHGDRSYDGLPLVCKTISDPLPLQRIMLVYDTRQRLSSAASAFVEEAKLWFSMQAIFSERGNDSSAS
ncbi:LysR family transcriptional regulator [Mesorhizobium sp. WSM2561]|uniref:LysR family transcriptional regulator n=1 Tax=Mesorhizobium sp. WSM2561 TaxID=1040985 RepID=UPI00047FE35C|nr:LysR family transcriptional regulator [Mesorhizobium sp. WSM2561]